MHHKIIYLIKKYGYKFYHFLHVLYSKINHFTFDIKNYSDTFLVHNYEEEYKPVKVKKVIYCFWTDTNPLTENRKIAIESMQKNMGVKVELITPQNLANYIIKEHPLHPSYKDLSAVHKSDYLRCYFMHHHGGGYADVKIFHKSWSKVFDKINENDNCYVIGYREIGKKSVGVNIYGKLKHDLVNHYPKLIGVCSFICKPYSPYTYEWINEVERRLDQFKNELSKFPGNTYGTNEGYPVPWSNLLADIVQPLQLKYNKHILYDNTLFFDIENSGR